MNNINIDLENHVDEDFFVSLKGQKSSKLQQLFVEDALSSKEKQQSLKYQRPKDIATSSNATSTTLMAKVVTAYKQGELLGKVGLALIQNPDYTFNIIIYKTKRNILMSLKLQPEKDFLYKQTNYWQFYDDESTYWSFSFDGNVDEEEFVEKLHDKSIIYKESEEKSNVTENHIESPNYRNEVQRCEAPATGIGETKNALIKRMAKMGKPLPILPYTNHEVTTEFSDSSDTEVIKTPLASNQKPSIAPRSNKLSNNVNQQLVPSTVGLNTIASAVYPINPLESQYMQMLLTEQRTQGSELRINMNKLENKIEKVLDKLELYDRNDGKQKTEKDDDILELEEKLLLLKKENRRLKLNLVEKSSVQSKDDKINDILYEFKDDLKFFNIDYKQNLKNILSALNDKLKESHKNLEQMQHRIDETEFKLEKLMTEVESNINKEVEQKNEISLLNQRENEFKLQLIEKEREIVKQKYEILDLQNKLQDKNKETLNDALVKSIMNNLYLDIADKLDNINLPNSEQILSLTASSIKQQTLKSLQESNPKKDFN